MNLHCYWTTKWASCSPKSQYTTGEQRRIKRQGARKGENRNEASRSRLYLKRVIAQLGVKLLIEAMREA